MGREGRWRRRLLCYCGKSRNLGCAPPLLLLPVPHHQRCHHHHHHHRRSRKIPPRPFLLPPDFVPLVVTKKKQQRSFYESWPPMRLRLSMMSFLVCFWPSFLPRGHPRRWWLSSCSFFWRVMMHFHLFFSFGCCVVRLLCQQGRCRCFGRFDADEIRLRGRPFYDWGRVVVVLLLESMMS